MTVGFFSPLPPAPTGVADYAAALLAGLRARGPVEVAVGRRNSGTDSPGSRLPRIDCTVPLYHLGNNGLHAAIYRRAIQEPGVVVLHDAVLHHFLLGQLPEAGYIEEFVYNYGEWNRGLAEDLWRARASSSSDPRFFEYPMIRRAVESARAVVVHNAAAARMVRAHVPAARVEEIPHLFAPPPLPSAAEAMRFRQRLGVPADAFLFGVFGYLRESKRLMAVIESFREARTGCPRLALLVAGGFVSADLERAAAPLLSGPGIFRLPHLSERDFWLAASAVDACINLRYPAAGETSGIAIRLMGIGKPVLVTEAEETSAFPPDACVRIPPGPSERPSLRAHMILLPSANDMAGEIGRRAAAHIRSCHAINLVSDRYWQLLCDVST